VPKDAATPLDVTITGNLRVTDSTARIRWSNLGDYVTNDGPDGERFNLTEGITANGTDLIHIHSTATETLLEYDPSHPGYDDFHIYGSSSAISYSFSGSATFNLIEEDIFNFGDLVNGTYDLNGKSTYISDSGKNLIIQYSFVPDTGSTAALLGAGVAALAFARRRLG